MNKKKMIYSFLSMILSLFAFSIATYAWFAISTQVDSNVNLSVDSGIIETSRFRIFAFDNVYQYNDTSSSLEVYSGGTWISPTYESDSEEAGYEFNGIIINQYDPIIVENNVYNNIIIEIRLTYDSTDSAAEIPSASLTAISDTSIATSALNEFDPLDEYTDYFLSEVANIQTLVYDAGASNPYSDTYYNLDQKYDVLSTLFEDTVTYPVNSFYTGDPESYTSSIGFDDISLTKTSSEVYIYFAISYYESKIASILAFDPQNIDLSNLSFVRFYQDIVFIISERAS